MSTSITGLQPWLQPWAQAMVSAAAPHGGTLASTYRSYSEQLDLYLNRKNNRYPVAPPGRSYHQLGRAFDINGPEWLLRQLGAWWRSKGGTWHESDIIHFQA